MTTVVVTESADVDVEVGDLVEVRLAETPATGYRWTLAAEAGVRIEADSFRPGSATPGSAGARRFGVRVVQPGAWRLHITLAREWESEPVESGVVTLRAGYQR